MDTFDRIAEDALSMSVSHTATSTSETVRGLGSTSGRALMRLGEVTLRGLEHANIQVRLQRIGFTVRSEIPGKWPAAYISDLLEFQRILVHPNNIRARAWDLIFIVMARGGHKQLYQAAIRWPEVELKLFVRQFALCKLSGWAAHPVDGSTGPVVPSMNVPNSSGDSTSDARPSSSDLSRALSNGLSSFFLELLVSHSTMLHESFAVDIFALCSKPDAPLSTWDFTLWSQGDRRYLDTFFHAWKPWDILQNRPTLAILRPEQFFGQIGSALSLCPQVNCFLRFVSSSTDQTHRQVVDYILQNLITPTEGSANSDVPKPPDDLHSYGTLYVHPYWSLLGWVTLLTYDSERMAELFVNQGILQVLDDLCRHRLLDASTTTPLTSLLMQLVCYVAVSSIHRNHTLLHPIRTQLFNNLSGAAASLDFTLQSNAPVVEQPPAAAPLTRAEKREQLAVLKEAQRQTRLMAAQRQREQARAVMNKRNQILSSPPPLTSESQTTLTPARPLGHGRRNTYPWVDPVTPGW